MAPQVTGDAEFMLIEGITPDRFYTVTDLTPGAPYLYRVKSLYVDGTESRWSNTKEVVLKEAAGVRGDIDGDGVVTIADVTMLIDKLMDGTTTPADDCDLSGSVSMDDVTALINYLLYRTWG